MQINNRNETALTPDIYVLPGRTDYFFVEVNQDLNCPFADLAIGHNVTLN